MRERRRRTMEGISRKVLDLNLLGLAPRQKRYLRLWCGMGGFTGLYEETKRTYVYLIVLVLIVNCTNMKRSRAHIYICQSPHSFLCVIYKVG